MDDEDIARRDAGVADPVYLEVGQATANQDQGRRLIVEVEVRQVGYTLAASEHTERPLEVDVPEQDQRDLGPLYEIGEPEAGENVIVLERAQIPNRHPAASEHDSTTGEIGVGPQHKSDISVCQLYHSF